MEDSMRFCPKCGTAAAPAAVPEIPAEQMPAVRPEETTASEPPAEPVRRRALPTDYRAINVMEYGSHGWPFVYPDVDENGRIPAEAADHGIGAPVIVRTITVKKKPKGAESYQQDLRARDIVLELYVTDARLILVCDKYDKGGTWYGGLAALALTAVERGVASARTKGKTLAGHVRYEWLKQIMYYRKSGILSDEQMRIVYKDRAGTQWQIDLVLDKHVDSSLVANDIMHRAAALRKNMRDDDGDIDEASRDWYTQHAHPAAKIPHNDEKDTFSYVSFPKNYLAPGGEGLNPEWRD
ncbi:MAG: hypothetical protein K6F13_05655 [Lachnospiraceae bacterium]|nr:hypothetical protein [Lachnospiraceae bacterium]